MNRQVRLGARGRRVPATSQRRGPGAAVLDELDGQPLLPGRRGGRAPRGPACLPWVREATVRRVWPDSIHIAVVERVAVARWNDQRADGGRRQRVLPEDGTAGPSPPGAPARGPTGSTPRCCASTSAWPRGFATLAGGVSRVSLSRSWAVGDRIRQRPDAGAASAAGRGGAAETFARALPGVLGEELQRAARIDLRYANGFAVRWRERPDGTQPARGSKG